MATFADALARERPRLLRRARRLCGGGGEAEDLVQETLSVALGHEDAFAQGTNFRAWLFTLMKYAHRNSARKSQRRQFLDKGLPNLVKTETPANQELSVALSQTLDAVEGLPRAQREVLVMVAMEGYSYAEAARIAGAPIGTIRSRLARARQNVQQHVEKRVDRASVNSE